MYGNWYSMDVGESSGYMAGNSCQKMYQYKTKRDINLYYLNDDKDLEYWLLYAQYFDLKVDSDDLYKIKFHDEFTIRSANNIIEKYNYTEFKNLKSSNKPVLFPSTTKKWEFIKLATSGDGDKPLAAKICYLQHNNSDNIHIVANGWEINQINHIMLCNIDNLNLENIYLSYDFYEKYLKNIKNVSKETVGFAGAYKIPSSRIDEINNHLEKELNLDEKNNCTLVRTMSGGNGYKNKSLKYNTKIFNLLKIK
jgi:hypothetical protein